MHTCVFCGAREGGVYKFIGLRRVCLILSRQREAGVADPVLDLMCNMMCQRDPATARELLTGGGEKTGEHADAAGGQAADGLEEGGENEGLECEGGGQEDSGDEELEEDGDEQTFLETCMCCYYWVSRRESQNMMPLPMQSLLWYVRLLEVCAGKKCDSRILLRLATTVTEEGNVFASLFHADELAGLAEIKHKRGVALPAGCPTSFKEQGESDFCIKRHIAELWHRNNGGSLLLPHAAGAELLRSRDAPLEAPP
jgi:hypothetical protein